MSKLYSPEFNQQMIESFTKMRADSVESFKGLKGTKYEHTNYAHYYLNNAIYASQQIAYYEGRTDNLAEWHGDQFHSEPVLYLDAWKCRRARKNYKRNRRPQLIAA